MQAKLVNLMLATVLLMLLSCSGGTTNDETSDYVRHYHAGVTPHDGKRLIETVEESDQAIRLNPEDAVAYFNRANALNDLGQYQRAIRDYGEAIRLDPELAIAYNNRGLSFLNLRSYQQAVQTFNDAIRVAPELGTAYAGRAFSYISLGRDQEANQDVEKAVDFGVPRGQLESEIEQLRISR